MKKMNQDISEALSAWKDGELPGHEVERLWGDLKKDVSMQQRWERYQLIGDALRNDLPAGIVRGGGVDLAGRVSQAILHEPAILAPRARSHARSRWHRPLAGLAMAASLGALAFVGLRTLDTGLVAAPGGPLQATAASRPAAPAVVPLERRRLDRYLMDHYEMAAGRSMKGMLPYASLVGYDRRP